MSYLKGSFFAFLKDLLFLGVMNRVSHKTKFKDKRGQGIGNEYIPWIKVSELPSVGTSGRILGIKTGRKHELLSYMEKSFFYICDLSDKIVDIQEQYPLLEPRETLEISEKLGIKYPPSFENESHVFTTDFLLTYHNKEKIAISIKPSGKINERQLELFTIEEYYWRKRNIDWRIVTEKDLPEPVVNKNIEHLQGSLSSFLQQKYPLEGVEQILQILKRHIEKESDFSLVHFAKLLDRQLELKLGTSLFILQSAIAKGLFKANLSVDLSSNEQLIKNFKIIYNGSLDKSSFAA
jgi:hypothetical protein